MKARTKLSQPKTALIKNCIKICQGLPNNCRLGIALSLIESCLMGVFYFLAIYFVNDLHLDITTASNIISCYGLGAIVGGYAGGKLSDKTSPLIISACSLGMQAIGYFALIFYQNPAILAINVFFLGLAAYGFITSNHLWILNQCSDDESQKLKAINLLATAQNLGLGLSGMYIGYLSQFGLKRIFALSAAAVLLLAFYLISYRDDSTNINEAPSEKYIVNTGPATTQPILWFVLLSVLFIGSVVSQLGSTYSIYIQDIFPKLGIQAVSILFTLNALIVVLFSLPIGNYIERYNKIFILGVGGFLIGIGMMMLSFSSLFFIAIVACIVYTIGEIIFFSMAQLICYQSGSKDAKGNSIGLFRTIYATSRIAGPAMGGYIYHSISGEMVWYVSGFIGILCFISASLFKNNYIVQG